MTKLANGVLHTYDQAIKMLNRSPNSPELQHRAVLALVRAGSLQFALTEYTRYGLDKIGALSAGELLEDIMALGGRLQKDLFLASSGAEAKEHALQSAERYETAFQKTDGYYSGINAATMALISGMPEAMIQDRARTILRKLPSPEKLDKQNRYFIQATRAEACLLLGEINETQAALRAALNHDPLNYIAHASTLKQFKMILEKRSAPHDWLKVFRPPQPAHFAGHMFQQGGNTSPGILDIATIDRLKVQISDALQQHDIGFGYGALAAGSDILIAETMLEEGCELNVVLPVAPELFSRHSVLPYGDNWQIRFEACMAQASSIIITSESADWPVLETDNFSRCIAMGKTVLQAEYLSVMPIQLLIWDEVEGQAGTAKGREKWRLSGRDQIILTYPGLRKTKRFSMLEPQPKPLNASVYRADTDTIHNFTCVFEAVKTAFTWQKSSDHTLKLGLHLSLGSDSEAQVDTARILAMAAVPGGILISEPAVSFLILDHLQQYAMDYMGVVDEGEVRIRAFSLQAKG